MSMQALMAASQSMARMQAMQSAGNRMQSSANILRIESKQDGGNEEKLSKADELEKKSGNLMGDLMGEITDVNETLKPDEDAKVPEKQEEIAAEKTQKADTVELSAAAIKHIGENTSAKPAALEAVTYNAAGNKAHSASAKAAPSFVATA